MIAVWLVSLMMFVPSNSISLANNNGVDNYLHNDIEEKVATFPIPIRRGKFFEGLITGTFWCGSSNAATYEGELGPNYIVDECCYIHGRCKYFIESGETKYGLTNSRPYTSVSCDCDKDLYKCLRTVDSDSSSTVIYLYSLTNPQCFIMTDEYRIVCTSAIPEQPCTRYRAIEEPKIWMNSSFRDVEPPVTAEPTILIENQIIKLINMDEDKVVIPLLPNYPLPLSHEQYQPQPQYSNHLLPPRYSSYPLQPQYSNNKQPPQNEHYQPPSHNEHYQPAPQNQLR